MTWTCPICGSKAYRRRKSAPLPATKFAVDADGTETRVATTLSETYFRCSGCSVFFGNPNLFNLTKVKKPVE